MCVSACVCVQSQGQLSGFARGLLLSAHMPHLCASPLPKDRPSVVYCITKQSFNANSSSFYLICNYLLLNRLEWQLQESTPSCRGTKETSLFCMTLDTVQKQPVQSFFTVTLRCTLSGKHCCLSSMGQALIQTFGWWPGNEKFVGITVQSKWQEELTYVCQVNILYMQHQVLMYTFYRLD